jgi:hypothetical protein
MNIIEYAADFGIFAMAVFIAALVVAGIFIFVRGNG